jgi:hypothetical protein
MSFTIILKFDCSKIQIGNLYNTYCELQPTHLDLAYSTQTHSYPFKQFTDAQTFQHLKKLAVISLGSQGWLGLLSCVCTWLGPSFTKLTCVSDLSFGDFILWNTYNFLKQCNKFLILNAKPELQWQILNKNFGQEFY